MSSSPSPPQRAHPDHRRYTTVQRLAAEAMGTAVLVLVGSGSVVAALVLAGDGGALSGGDLLGIAVAFGLVIAAVVYAFAKVSGCHINPAVTFALAVTKRFPWKDVPPYWAAQVVGATVGALGIWAAFGQVGLDVGLGQAAFDSASVGWGSAMFAEGFGTFVLMLGILGIVDARSPGDVAGLVIGGVVIAVLMVFGPVSGAAINPARAFGPELVAAIGDADTAWSQLIPVYVMPPLAGAALAAFAYDFLAEPRREQMPIKAAVTHTESEALR